MSTFIPFLEGDTVDSIARVFSSAWSDNTDTLTTNHFSSSAQYNTTSATSSGAYFMEIYSTNPDDNPTTAEVQYSIAYGHRKGSGSLNIAGGATGGANGFNASKAIYTQYRNLVYGGDENQNFSFDGHTPDDIFVLNVNRARYKNSLRMGNQFNLTLSGSGTRNLELTDDSVTTSGSANAIRPGVGREFNLVSGSSGVRVGSTNTYVTDSGSYGLVYPDAGLIVLNGDALNASVADFGLNLSINRNSHENGLNPVRLQNSLISGSLFQIDSQEDIASKFYFVRVQNQEFNYTTNDSFTEDDGTLKFDSMIDNPQTYITTVGLYNDAQDLLAVAKLSQPLPKDFTKEALIKVKLDY